MNVEPYPIKTNDYKVDHNLERYSDKVWQSGRKFGMEQAIGDVLEIIDEVKSDANKGYMFDMVDEIENRVLDLKGEQE